MPLPVDESLRLHLLDNRPRCSPDGQLLAYTVSDTSKSPSYGGKRFTQTGVSIVFAGKDVWITNTRTGESHSLTEGKGTSWSPTWSPDGKSLAFFSDRGGKAQLWIWDRTSQRMRPVSDAIVRQYAPLAEFRSWNALQWTPDNKKVLTKILPEDMSIEEAEAYINSSSSEPEKPLAEGASVTVYRSSTKSITANKTDAEVVRNYRQKVMLGDLGLIDVLTGQVQRVARRVHATRYDLSPDGSYVAYLEAKGINNLQAKFFFDLISVSLLDGRPHVLAADVSQSVLGMSSKWSPDSKLLAYIDGPQVNSNCFVVSRDGGAPRKLIDVQPPAYDNERGLPIWDASTQEMYFLVSDSLKKVVSSSDSPSVIVKIPNHTGIRLITPAESEGQFWSPDKRFVYLRVLDNGTRREAIYKVNFTNGEYSELRNGGDSDAHALAFLEASITGQAVIYKYEDTKHAEDLWIAEPGQKNSRQLTHSNPVFEQYVLGEPRMIEWLNDDGVKRRGAVLLPAGYEEQKHYPVIVWVYGSNKLSNEIDKFGFGLRTNMHLLATRGYVVFFPDSSVSVGTPMLDIAKNILPGINKLIEMGIADPERLGVAGHSYGGYTTLALIAQTNRFKAAVWSAGISDLVSYYGSKMSESGTSEAVAWAEDSQGSMGGSPWEYRERYIENSPIFYLDRIQTPLLLLHGDLDPVPASQADEVFIGLRRLGKEVEYAKYAGEGHGFILYANQVDYWKRLIAWLDNHLKKPQGLSALPEQKPRVSFQE